MVTCQIPDSTNLHNYSILVGLNDKTDMATCCMDYSDLNFESDLSDSYDNFRHPSLQPHPS